MAITSTSYINVPELPIEQAPGYVLTRRGVLVLPTGEEISADEYTLVLKDGTSLTIERSRLMICLFKRVNIDMRLWNDIIYADFRYVNKPEKDLGTIVELKHYAFLDMGRGSDVTVDGKVYRRVASSFKYGISVDGDILYIPDNTMVVKNDNGLEEKVSIRNSVTTNFEQTNTAILYASAWHGLGFRDNVKAADPTKALAWNNFVIEPFDTVVGAHTKRKMRTVVARDHFTREVFEITRISGNQLAGTLNVMLGINTQNLSSLKKISNYLVPPAWEVVDSYHDETLTIPDVSINDDMIRQRGAYEIYNPDGSIILTAPSKNSLTIRMGTESGYTDSLISKLPLTQRYRLCNLSVGQNLERVETDPFFDDAFIWRKKPVGCIDVMSGKMDVYNDLSEALHKSNEVSRNAVELALMSKGTTLTPSGNLFYYMDVGYDLDKVSCGELVLAGHGTVYDLIPSLSYSRGRAVPLGPVNHMDTLMNLVKVKATFTLFSKHPNPDRTRIIKYTDKLFSVCGENKLMTKQTLMKRFPKFFTSIGELNIDAVSFVCGSDLSVF